jgi:cell division protein FtsB
MSHAIRKWTVTAALVGVGTFAVYTLQGPRGIQNFLDHQQEIRKLQMQNFDLMKENQRKREYLERLSDSASEQDKAIRERLKLLRPGEKTFILPEGRK